MLIMQYCTTIKANEPISLSATITSVDNSEPKTCVKMRVIQDQRDTVQSLP